jgi:cyclic pyranopterin phosphate synthase
MTTNGLVLSKNLPKLKDAGLNILNISLDTLIESKFTFITRRQGHSRVLDVIIFILQYIIRQLILLWN